MAEGAKITGEFVNYLKGKRPVIRKRWVEVMQAKDLLAGLSDDEVETESVKIYDICVECLETGKFDGAQTYAKTMAEQGVLAGMTSEQIVMGMLNLRDVYGRAIFENYGKDPEKSAKVLDVYEPVANTILGIVSDAFVKEREKLIEEQQEALRCLYGISSLLQKSGISLEEILERMHSSSFPLPGSIQKSLVRGLSSGIEN